RPESGSEPRAPMGRAGRGAEAVEFRRDEAAPSAGRGGANPNPGEIGPAAGRVPGSRLVGRGEEPEMNAVTAPLKVGQKGQAVADLHRALQWLLDHAGGVEATDAAKKEYALLLRREADAQAFGSTTAKLVSLVQRVAGLPATGAVDAPTAEAIIARVKKS